MIIQLLNLHDQRLRRRVTRAFDVFRAPRVDEVADAFFRVLLVTGFFRACERSERDLSAPDFLGSEWLLPAICAEILPNAPPTTFAARLRMASPFSCCCPRVLVRCFGIVSLPRPGVGSLDAESRAGVSLCAAKHSLGAAAATLMDRGRRPVGATQVNLASSREGLSDC